MIRLVRACFILGLMSRLEASQIVTRESLTPYEFVFQDLEGRLRSFEARVGTLALKHNHPLVRYTLYRTTKTFYEVTGERSAVRFSRAAVPTILGRLKAGQRPGEIVELYRFTVVDGKRVIGASRPKKPSPNRVPVTFEEEGGSIVRIILSGIEPGEYGLSTVLNNEVYCFGIDP
ncbi:MAG: hypothetical protein ACKV22_13230 [Bryobacteraceae bacterium]